MRRRKMQIHSPFPALRKVLLFPSRLIIFVKPNIKALKPVESLVLVFNSSALGNGPFDYDVPITKEVVSEVPVL